MATQKPKTNQIWRHGTTQIQVEAEKLFNREFSLKEFEEEVASIKAEIPVEFHDSTKIELLYEKEWYAYESEPTLRGGIKVTYIRPETEQEKKDREGEEQRLRNIRMAAELEELTRLQAKYANKT